MLPRIRLALLGALCLAAGLGLAIPANAQTCYTTADFNHNGLSFEVSDWVILDNFINGLGPAPDPLYEGDLTADGYIDFADAACMDSIIQGLLQPPPLPISTVCLPDTIRGACWEYGFCAIRSAANCAGVGGVYQGDGTSCAGPCLFDANVDGDGIAPTVADLVFLIRFINFDGPPPNPLYRGDVNGDGYIDISDALRFDSMFHWGLPFVPPLPWPTPCHTDTIRGACWEGDSCTVRSPVNCSAVGGVYQGNAIVCACNCAGFGDLNLDGAIDPLDVVVIINLVYKGIDQRQPLPPGCPLENGDYDCDNNINPVDVVRYVNFVYRQIGSGPCDPCAPTGKYLGSTGCKSAAKVTAGAAAPFDQDCLDYRYDGQSALTLRHLNAGFNCCPEIACTVVIEGDVITIDEKELAGQCHCLCLFDLDFVITNLPPGTYTFRVTEPYVQPGDEPLEFTVDLSSSPSGTYCVPRSHYPWGNP